MKQNIVLLTRCPIHGRRFHRFNVEVDHSSFSLPKVSDAGCCEHLRRRRVRVARKNP